MLYLKINIFNTFIGSQDPRRKVWECRKKEFDRNVEEELEVSIN